MLQTSVEALSSPEGAVFVAVLLLSAVFAKAAVPLARRSTPTPSTPELTLVRLRTQDVYVVAGVFGGAGRIVDTAITTLVAADQVCVGMGGRLYAVAGAHVQNPVEAAVWAELAAELKGRSPHISLGVERRAIMDEVLDRIQAQGLLLPASTMRTLRWIAGVMSLATVISCAVVLATTEVARAWSLVPGVIVLFACLPKSNSLSAEGKRLRDVAATAAPPIGVVGDSAAKEAVWLTVRRGLRVAGKKYPPLDGLTFSGEDPPENLDERSLWQRWAD